MAVDAEEDAEDEHTTRELRPARSTCWRWWLGCSGAVAVHAASRCAAAAEGEARVVESRTIGIKALRDECAAAAGSSRDDDDDDKAVCDILFSRSM